MVDLHSVAKKFKKSRRGRPKPALQSTEVKYHSVDLATILPSIADSWLLTDLTYLANSTDIISRLGRRVLWTSFHIIGTLVGGQSNLVTDDSYNTVRFILFSGVPGLATADFAGLGINNEVRVGTHGINRILFDSWVTLEVPASDSTGYIPAVRTVNRRSRFRLRSYYDQSGADYATGGVSLYLIAVSDSAAVSNPGFTTGKVTVTFCDML